MKERLIAVLQAAVNRYLALDPEHGLRVQKLKNKVVQLELADQYKLQLHFMDKDIQFTSDLTLAPDVIIQGTPLSLIHMTLSSEQQRHHFFGKEVLIKGNLELGQQIIDLFDQLEIDWEEYLSRLLGDVSAHQVGRIARGVKKWGLRTRDILLQDVNEYTHEEINLFPSPEALQDFFSDIDTARMDADRLEMRLKKLSQIGDE